MMIGIGFIRLFFMAAALHENKNGKNDGMVALMFFLLFIFAIVGMAIGK